MATKFNDHTVEINSVEQIKRKTRERRLRAVQSLAERLQVAPDGTRYFIRFSPAQRVEHYFLMVSFTTLAVTGLLQTFSRYHLVGLIIQILGNVETVRTIHRLAAVTMILQSLYHVWGICVTWFVKRERGAMWPRLSDFRNLLRGVFFNLGLVKQRPQWDRFSFEEKIEYWAMLWGTPVMIITGLVLWFPTVFTSVLPGVIVPTALTIHAWEAILATLAILTWHMYNTIIKEHNTSIFTGKMTEEEMQHSHPLEYQRILDANDYLHRRGFGDDGRQSTRITRQSIASSVAELEAD
jgi:cytochrome b subunit of formate dehydrogenase